MNRLDNDGCDRQPKNGDCFVSELQLNEHEQALLCIVRLFLHSFTYPESQSWVIALSEAEKSFGEKTGNMIASRALKTLRAIRFARRANFAFNSATCPGCSVIATEQERHMMGSLAAIRRGDIGFAQMELMILCEGNQVDKVLEAMRALAQLLADPNNLCATPACLH
jgi:hypothetical protein